MEVASVWKDEINRALMVYTQKAVVLDRNGSPYKVPVQMRKPDETLKLEAYPCITWYNLMDLSNTDRTDNVEYTYVNKETKEAINYYLPIPFDMYYQIDFWGKTWTDVDNMSKKWLQSLPPYSRGKFFNLPVRNSIGNLTSVLCIQKDILRRRDTLTQGDKDIHTTITYSIQGYLGRTYNEHSGLIETVILSKEGF